MRVAVVTPPNPVILTADAKDHLRVLHDDDDALIDSYVAAATAHIDGPDGWLGRAIGPQMLELHLPAFGSTSITLPYPPAIEIAEIEYIDASGAAVTCDPAVYELRGNHLRAAWGKTWPVPAWRGAEGEVVRIRYRAGYQELPKPIRAAILLMTGDLYAFRETAVTGTISVKSAMSITVTSLLAPFRVFA